MALCSLLELGWKRVFILFILSIDTHQMLCLQWTLPRLLKAECCAWHTCLPWAQKAARDKACAMFPLSQFLSFSRSHFKYFPCFRPHLNLQPPRTHSLPQLLLNWVFQVWNKCSSVLSHRHSTSCVYNCRVHHSWESDIANHEVLVHFLPNAICDDPATSSSSSYNWHELPSETWLSGVCNLPAFPLDAAFTWFFINAFLDAMMALLTEL